MKGRVVWGRGEVFNLDEVGSKWVRWANGVGTTLAVCGGKLVCSIIFGLTIK